MLLRGFFETTCFGRCLRSARRQAIIQRRPGAIPAPRKLPPLEVLAPESPSHGSEQNGGENAEDGSLGWRLEMAGGGWWWIDGGVSFFFFEPTQKNGGVQRRMAWLSYFFYTMSLPEKK